MDPLQELFDLFEAATLKPKVVKPKLQTTPEVEDEPQGHSPDAVVKGLSGGLDRLAADLKGEPEPNKPKLQDPNPLVRDPQGSETPVDPNGPTIGTPPDKVHPEAERNQRTKDAIAQGLSPEDAFAAETGKPPMPQDAAEYAKVLAAYSDDERRNITEPDKDSQSVFGKDANVSDASTPEEAKAQAEDQRRDAALVSDDPKIVSAEINDISDEIYDLTSELDQLQNVSLEELQGVTDRIRKRTEKLFGVVREQFSKIPSEANKKSFMHAMIHARTYGSRNNSKKGKNQLGYLDVKNLVANRDRLVQGYGDGSPQAIESFVRSVRTIEVSDDFIAASYEVLPAKFKQVLKIKGKVGEDEALKNIHFLGYNKDGSVRRGQASTNDRARLLWRLYLEQGGVDAYTGLPLDLESMDLEHVRGFNNKDSGPITEEDHKNREHEKNMVLTASNVNQMKKDMGMEEFLVTQVDEKKDWPEEQYGGSSAMYDRHNQIVSESVQFAKHLMDGQNFTLDITPDLIKEYFTMDDAKYEQLRKEINESTSLDKKQKASLLATLRSQLGKEIITALGLTRGTKTPDARPRTTSFPADNIYRGFIYSMIKAGPEEYDAYKSGWAAAIFAANNSRDKKDAVRVLKELGLIDSEVLDDKKMGRPFREDFDWADNEIGTEPLDLVEDYDYNEDVDFLRTYGRA